MITKPHDEAFNTRFSEASVLRDKGEFSAAEIILRDLLELRPNEKAVWVVLGHLRWEQKDLHDAIECFRKAVVLDPVLELASLGLYHTLWSSGQKEEALEEMKRFIQVSHSEEYDRLLQAFRESRDSE
jgi:predicted Zn-dependent protease